MNYRMIACSVSEYDPDEITIEEISEMDEFDQDYFIIEESDSLDALRLIAVEICAEWWDAGMPNVVENCDGDVVINLLSQLIEKTEAISKIGVGEKVVDVCSKNDWLRIEEV